MPHFFQGTGLVANSTEVADLFTNWSATTTAALAAVQAAGGFTWSNVNCELDPFYGPPCDPAIPGNCSQNDVFVGERGVHTCGHTKSGP